MDKLKIMENIKIPVSKVVKVLSDILSDKYGLQITVTAKLKTDEEGAI